ncbi:PLP-dependent aminotransferase family protein [uncultured Cedecea sp.]|uniref:MocR-like transcription factor YczR n=1 Tax=uncultured Cedecea sp. TaxID=988762 RepID=UPI002616BD2B|nr:PLP-dependent aminotransferase family protein [uncultured Cedecea sp.]
MSQRRIGATSLSRLLGEWHQENSRIPVYQQLAGGLRLLILDGRLPLDSRLPGERDLSTLLNVSRTTLTSALALLREQGYLASRQGSGSVTLLPESNPAVSPLPGIAPVLDLSGASLSAGPEIHQAYATALTALPEYLGSTGYNSQGILPLREAIAERYCSRGLPTDPDQIMVVNGALSGLGLVLRLLTGPGDRVVIENPTYSVALATIRGTSCRPVAVSLPSNGWDVEGLAATIAQTSPRLAYLLPDFHNPTGRCMDKETRQRICDVAAASRTALVIDETMVDLWFDQPPPPPVAAFDHADNVITLGSASKSFWGGLRVGWIRASRKTINALIQVRNTFDLGTPILEQLATIALLNEANSFLPQRRDLLRQRRDASFAALGKLFPDWKTEQPEGGLSWWIALPKAQATVFAAHAESAGIRIGAGPRFGVDGAFERYLRLPFTLETQAMYQALERLQPIWQLLMEEPSERTRGIIV